MTPTNWARPKETHFFALYVPQESITPMKDRITCHLHDNLGTYCRDQVWSINDAPSSQPDEQILVFAGTKGYNPDFLDITLSKNAAAKGVNIKGECTQPLKPYVQSLITYLVLEHSAIKRPCGAHYSNDRCITWPTTFPPANAGAGTRPPAVPSTSGASWMEHVSESYAPLRRRCEKLEEEVLDFQLRSVKGEVTLEQANGLIEVITTFKGDVERVGQDALQQRAKAMIEQLTAIREKLSPTGKHYRNAEERTPLDGEAAPSLSLTRDEDDTKEVSVLRLIPPEDHDVIVEQALYDLKYEGFTFTRTEKPYKARYQIAYQEEPLLEIEVGLPGSKPFYRERSLILDRLINERPQTEWTPEERALVAKAGQVLRALHADFDMYAQAQAMITAKQETGAPQDSNAGPQEGEEEPADIQDREDQGSTPRSDTLGKIAMVRQIMAVWGLSKRCACRCVGTKPETYNRYNDVSQYQKDIKNHLDMLDESGFLDRLKEIPLRKWNETRDIYKRFWANPGAPLAP